MNGGSETWRDLQGVTRQDRQLAITVFGSAKIRCDARKAEARRATLQTVQPFANTFGWLDGKFGKRLRQLRSELKQPLLAKQREELSNARLVDVLHRKEPR